MNRFDDHLRKKLEAERIEPNPVHTEQFSKLLDERNGKKPRPLLWWLWGIIIVAGAGFLVNQFSGSGKRSEKFSLMPNTMTSEEAPATSPEETGPVNASSPGTMENPGQRPIGQFILPPEETKDPGIEKELSGEKTRSAQQGRGLVEKPASRDQSHDAPMDSKILTGTTETNAPQKNGLKTTNPEFSQSLSAKETIGPKEKNTGRFPDSDDAGPVRDRYPDVAKISFYSTVSTVSPNNHDRNPAFPFISRTTLTSRVKKWHFGASLGYGLPPETGLPKKASHLIHFGGFVQRKLDRKWSVGMDAGFAFQRGGIEFEKSSALTQYGFGLRSTINTLQLREAYAAYAGLFGQYHLGRHFVEASVSARYLYGAKGDISRFVEDDFRGVEEEYLQNVWIDTEGLRKISVDAGVGYGYRIAPFMSILMKVRIPVSGFTDSRSQYFLNEDYFIDSEKQKLIPELGLRFNLFRI